jgi:hypothetical protein
MVFKISYFYIFNIAKYIIENHNQTNIITKLKKKKKHYYDYIQSIMA